MNVWIYKCIKAGLPEGINFYMHKCVNVYHVPMFQCVNV